MAVVITSDDASRFAPAMRRSQSQPKFASKQNGFRQSSSASRISDLYQQPLHTQPIQAQQRPAETQPEPEPYQQIPVFSDSDTSSTASSPRTAATGDARLAENSPSKLLVPSLRLPRNLGRPGYGSSPNGTDDGHDADGTITYAHYDGTSYFNPTKDDDTVSPQDNTTVSTGPSRTNSDFDLFEHAAEDDTAVRTLPSRHVDYLSHNWKEEDIWESWKYIVSRRGDYTNSARLENASWRTWMKSKNKLKTVSPETLNWLKDCDVTWLYGPLQVGHAALALASGQTTDSVELTKSNSFLVSNKKTILKKRSMSEVMLQRSLSASSLLKQAAAAVHAQQKDHRSRKASRPRLERAATDYVTFPFSSHRFHSTGLPSMLPSASSSSVESPSVERKHIHFNEQVEQCIAVDIKGDDSDDEGDSYPQGQYDSDSEDDAIMMKQQAARHRLMPKRRHSYMSHMESKTIAMLPSTTLKYLEDAPDSPSSSTSAMKHSYRSPTVLSPSSSQETLRPSKMSGRLFIDDEEEEVEVEGIEVVQQAADSSDSDSNSDSENDSDSDSDDGFGMAMGRKRGLVSSASTSRLGGMAAQAMSGSLSNNSGGGGLKRTTSTNSLAAEPAGMRRTASGMFMPKQGGLLSRHHQAR